VHLLELVATLASHQLSTYYNIPIVSLRLKFEVKDNLNIFFSSNSLLCQRQNYHKSSRLQNKKAKNISNTIILI